MANYTSNLNLKKPLRGEYYDVADSNSNMDKIDTHAGAVNAQLAQTATQLDSEGINILTPPSPLVGVIQGEEDSSAKINNMINFAAANGLTNIIIPVDVNIKNTIFCKEGVNLTWKNNAVLYVMANVNAIDYNKNVVLDDPKVSSFNMRGGYTKALIYLDGNKRISTAPHRTQINNPQLWGWTLNISGYGIHVYGGDNVANDKLSYIEVNNPKN